MKQVQKVWAELSKTNKAPKRTKLSAKKRGVKLNIVNEIENVMDYSETAYSEASYITQELMPEMEEQCYDIRGKIDNIIVNSEANSLEDFADELSGLISTIEDSANELGIDPEDIFDRFGDANELLANMRGMQDEWDSMEDNFPYAYRLTNLR